MSTPLPGKLLLCNPYFGPPFIVGALNGGDYAPHLNSQKQGSREEEGGQPQPFPPLKAEEEAHVTQQGRFIGRFEMPLCGQIEFQCRCR